MKRFSILIILTFLCGWFAVRADETTNEEISILPDRNELKLKRNTGGFIYVSGGPALILTEVEMGNVVSGEPTFSGQINAGFEWIFKKKLGVGFMYNGYFTGVESREWIGGYNSIRLHERWALHYFAPQFTGRILLRSTKWSLRYAIGLGLVVSREVVTSKGELWGRNYDFGLGSNMSFGVEFLITPTIGISGGVKAFDASINQYYMSESNSAGIIRVDLDFGISFHF